jgi:hypothetical protein
MITNASSDNRVLGSWQQAIHRNLINKKSTSIVAANVLFGLVIIIIIIRVVVVNGHS